MDEIRSAITTMFTPAQNREEQVSVASDFLLQIPKTPQAWGYIAQLLNTDPKGFVPTSYPPLTALVCAAVCFDSPRT